MNKLQPSYKITLDNSGYTDWSFLPDDTAFLLYLNVSSKYVQVSSAIPHMIVYADFLDSTTHTTIGSTVHPFSSQYMCSPINRNYSDNREVLTVTNSNRVPLYLPCRPTNNNHIIRFLESTSNNAYAASFYGIGMYYQLLFIPYVSPIPAHIKDPATPFNVILNSANGTVINTKSYIEYNYNWANHYNPNPNQKYKMIWFLQSMGMNTSSNQPFVISASFLPVANNYYVSSSTTGANNSNIIGNCYAYDYSTLSNYLGGPTTNSEIMVTLPSQNIFNIQFFDIGTTTLFIPTTGAMQDYQLILNFMPV